MNRVNVAGDNKREWVESLREEIEKRGVEEKGEIGVRERKGIIGIG